MTTITKDTVEEVKVTGVIRDNLVSMATEVVTRIETTTRAGIMETVGVTTRITGVVIEEDTTNRLHLNQSEDS